MSAPAGISRPSSARARKRRRMYAVLAGLTMIAIAVALVLTAFEDSIVFFYSPTDVVEKGVAPERRVRIGGLVKENSIEKADGGLTTTFVVTDLTNTLRVSYTGILPDLFGEGQGVVAEGKLSRSGVFLAAEVLAKHDENYMPREVADALKKSGKWRDPNEGPAK